MKCGVIAGSARGMAPSGVRMKRAVTMAVGGALVAVAVASPLGLMTRHSGASTVVAAAAAGREEQVARPESGGAKSITLPQMAPDLPPGPGREAVNGACIVCHSTRYITMQPRFSRKAW